MAIEVVEYDPGWASTGDAGCRELLGLPALFLVVEHIGSTAVPGLAAKPIIDLMASADDLDAVVRREGELGEFGYRRLETGMSGRLFYARGVGGRRTHQLHVVPAETWDVRNERLLRDHLRTNPDAVTRYADLKRTLAVGSTTADEYTRAKTALIQELTDRARRQRGLPIVPVWES